MKRKLLVLCTSVIAIALFLLLCLVEERGVAPFKIEEFPRLGNTGAKVQLLAFEDFFCSHCRLFNEEIFPKIRSAYIDKGKAYYVLVPLAFVEGSKPLANAALAVHAQAPERFFPYAERLFSSVEHQAVGREALLRIAREVGGIDLDKLQQSIDKRAFYRHLDRHLEQTRRFMGGEVRTPALYVNGVRVLIESLAAIQAEIEEALQ